MIRGGNNNNKTPISFISDNAFKSHRNRQELGGERKKRTWQKNIIRISSAPLCSAYIS
ncbi:MAG TPA: hypothetical protein VH415_03070 [Nitrososphaeraceae archaeon]